MWLFVPLATAAPLTFGLGLGPVVGGGESALGSWMSVGPQLTGDVSVQLGWIEGWAGLSASGLLAGGADGAIPAALLQAEVGLGFGNRMFTAGLYGGGGYPGGELGLYGRGTTRAPRWSPRWAKRVGAEARLTWLGATDSTAFSLLFRVEPGERRAKVREPHEVPYEEAPPAPTHHDEPY